ncbi:MAG: NAD(P)-binding protein [Planctomycetes bacterium]|nr:NAD(P)-binding protein [Planctomycetota bacterium]MCB9902826.1 NAD(P)-binding protein [Planctomycetota bacterium]
MDLLVIGAGFGGLGAGLRAAELGAMVVVLEAQAYPGGCASTFEHAGSRFESGATLFSGLGDEQLFGRWIERHGIDVEVDWLDPLVEYRSPRLELGVGLDRDAFVERLCALPGAPREALRRFFAFQERSADRLWRTLEEPGALPPFGAGALWRHAKDLPAWSPILRCAGKSLSSVLARFGLSGFAPLEDALNALCQITVQCGADEAEAPFALAAADYYWRGTGHVRGGIGRLASGLCEAILDHGGEARFGKRVRCIEPHADGGWWVHTLGESLHAERVIANLLPPALDATIAVGVPRSPRLQRYTRELQAGWGACMLYLELDDQPGAAPHHLQLVQDPDALLTEGNHLFVSVSGCRDEQLCSRSGGATATVSTHVPIAKLRALATTERGAYVRGVQDKMRRGLRELAPELDARVRRVLPASPRTFERYTGRTHGMVGGLPRRVGLRQYMDLSNPPIAPGLWMVGDTVFPGQSIYASATCGVRAAERALSGARVGLSRSAASVGSASA